jgi:hypothetical protein
VIQAGTHGLPAADPPGPAGVGSCALEATRWDSFSGDDLLIGQAAEEAQCTLYRLSGGPGGPSADGPAVNMGSLSPSGPIDVGWDATTGAVLDEVRYRSSYPQRVIDIRPRRQTMFSGFISQDTPGVPGKSERADNFGSGRDLVDLNADGVLDMIIGVSGESIADATGTGSVTIVHRRADNGAPTATGNFVIHQDKAGVPGTNASGDGFGSQVYADDFDGDGRPDILISAPNDMLDGVRPGVLTVAYSRRGLGYRRLQQNTAGIPGTNEDGDQFGDYLVKTSEN